MTQKWISFSATNSLSTAFSLSKAHKTGISKGISGLRIEDKGLRGLQQQQLSPLHLNLWSAQEEEK